MWVSLTSSIRSPRELFLREADVLLRELHADEARQQQSAVITRNAGDFTGLEGFVPVVVAGVDPRGSPG